MKKQRLLLTATLALSTVALLTTQSCTKLAKNLQYDLAMQTASVQIVLPQALDTMTASAGTQTNYYNIDSFIKANTANVLGVSNITSAKLQSVVLSLTNPSASNNFANFKSCYGSFYTNSNTTPYQVSVANNPDVYSTQMSLPVDTTAELKGYLGANNFTYSVGGSLRRVTTYSLHITAQITFKVHVQG